MNDDDDGRKVLDASHDSFCSITNIIIGEGIFQYFGFGVNFLRSQSR
jgi:hypothetical protein